MWLLAQTIGSILGGLVGVGIIWFIPGSHDPGLSWYELAYAFVLSIGGVCAGILLGAMYADRKGWY